MIDIDYKDVYCPHCDTQLTITANISNNLEDFITIYVCRSPECISASRRDKVRHYYDIITGETTLKYG